MVATVENYGPDALEDWEVDELLDWTTSLNFDEYVLFIGSCINLNNVCVVLTEWL